MTDFLDRTAAAWCALAGATDAMFRPGEINVVTAEASKLAPPGWVGIVRLTDAALVTTPSDEISEQVRQLTATVSPTLVCDPEVLFGDVLPAEVLGPTTLAYLDASMFRPDGTAGVETTTTGDEIAALEKAAGAEDADEAAVNDVTSPVFVTRAADGTITAACGYRVWMGTIAHVCVLVHPDQRRRGLGSAVGTAATAHALAAGFVPQWRARRTASRALARALGYSYVGDQLSYRPGMMLR
ncbi:MAG TPA: GNAT family N-acetyltransferase [Micromonosporaceae bacterium]|jgi:GNAT superfamily N-acetyltransferase